MKKVIRLTEGDLHRIIKESVRRVIKESSDNIITCYGSRKVITGDYIAGGGSLLGDGVIYLSMNPDVYNYNNDMIAVDVDVSNFYRASDARDAIAIARDNQEGYSGVIYHSKMDGDVCAIFDPSCIIGKSY